MKKWQIVNIALFFLFFVSTASLVYALKTLNYTSPFSKPWHLSPSISEDSLSQKYLDEYVTIDKKSLLSHFYDSTRNNVFILVDAWGVPTDENLMEKDFSLFATIPHICAIHKRLANRTKHAERVEFRHKFHNSIYLFGGDSLEYNRNGYIKDLGFGKTLFCQHCNDSMMLFKIDSLHTNDSLHFIAWTTQSSRSGYRDSLSNTLKMISTFARQHPNINIVVQGTHRPILCNSKTRNTYKSHWVPVVILNKSKKDADDTL